MQRTKGLDYKIQTSRHGTIRLSPSKHATNSPATGRSVGLAPSCLALLVLNPREMLAKGRQAGGRQSDRRVLCTQQHLKLREEKNIRTPLKTREKRNVPGLAPHRLRGFCPPSAPSRSSPSSACSCTGPAPPPDAAPAPPAQRRLARPRQKSCRRLRRPGFAEEVVRSSESPEVSSRKSCRKALTECPQRSPHYCRLAWAREAGLREIGAV
eukprot:scaffold149_cov315-Pinguiococcus_pyrenoidosus.AAC.103